jgi:WhiB family transcriptional regulator, redox-sensing transcriptional regulator
MQVKRTYVSGAGPPDWRLQAECVTADLGLFFGPARESRRAKQFREAAAVAVCHRCGVVGECRAWTLAAGMPFGVCGGLSEGERLELAGAGSAVTS